MSDPDLSQPAAPEPEPPSAGPPNRGPLYRSAWSFYLVLASAGLLWLGFSRGDLELSYFLPFPDGWIDLALGAATAVGLVVLWRGSRLVFPVLRELERTLRRVLGPLDGSQAFVLAFISGFAEEVFFRGAMTASWGWIWATLIFTVIHTGPGREVRAWTAFAFVAGLAFAALEHFRANLLGAMTAHFLVNWIQLRYLGAPPPAAGRGEEAAAAAGR